MDKSLCDHDSSLRPHPSRTPALAEKPCQDATPKGQQMLSSILFDFEIFKAKTCDRDHLCYPSSNDPMVWGCIRMLREQLWNSMGTKGSVKNNENMSHDLRILQKINPTCSKIGAFTASSTCWMPWRKWTKIETQRHHKND